MLNFFPEGQPFCEANFNHIKALCELESTMSVRMAHKLNKSVLSPTNIQRASTFALFCDSTVAAVKYHASHGFPQWKDTCEFLSYVTNLVKMCNIRSKHVGKKSRDCLKYPFTSASDERLHRFL